MRQARSKNTGMTLVEIIIALAILGIITVSFLGMFSSSIMSIFAMGENSKSVVVAQAIIDQLYQGADRSSLTYDPDNPKGYISSLSITELDGISYKVYKFKDNSFYSFDETDDDNAEIRFQVEESDLNYGTNVKTITVLVFYQNGNRYIELVSPLPDL